MKNNRLKNINTKLLNLSKEIMKMNIQLLNKITGTDVSSMGVDESKVIGFISSISKVLLILIGLLSIPAIYYGAILITKDFKMGIFLMSIISLLIITALSKLKKIRIAIKEYDNHKE